MTKLDELLMHIKHDHVYIQTHNFPDPDAIGSAFGLQYLLKHKGISSTLCYYGKVARHSTRKMIEKSHIDIKHMNNCNLKPSDEIILVDAQCGNSNLLDIIGEEIICIDHHPILTEPFNYRYKDIRPSVGACCSIIADYFFENNIPISSNVATALINGIKVDTANLTRAVSQLDLDMFYKLFNLSKTKLLEELDHSSLQISDLNAYAHAIQSIQCFGDVSFAYTGKGCPDTLVASISDFMLDMIEVNFSIVYSIIRDGIKLSIRSNPAFYDAGLVTLHALKGIGTGGGHSTMAGAFIPFKHWDEYELLDTIRKRYMDTLDNLYPVRTQKKLSQ